MKHLKIYIAFLSLIITFLIPIHLPIVNAANTSNADNNPPSDLHAKYAALLDADSGRVLFEKNGYAKAPMASTTKIMTLITALSIYSDDNYAEVSAYAASMPDVQLNVTKGQIFNINDLYYSLMLKSHNDTAVVIAENAAFKYITQINTSEYHVSFDLDALSIKDLSKEQSAELVHIFTNIMNKKALELGCESTYFITPNGLDASDENGVHSTTAIDLTRIMAYCIKDENFLSITQTSSHTFTDKLLDSSGNIINGSHSYSVNNANAFFNMMDGVLSGKTGFTGDAGYCYVCALKRDGRTYISVVLACGWPPSKTYKWADTRALLTYGINNFFPNEIISSKKDYCKLKVDNGIEEYTTISIPEGITTLTSITDKINVLYNMPDSIKAPVNAGETAGNIDIYINDVLYKSIPLIIDTSVKRKDAFYYIYRIFCNYIL